uniref:Chitinase-3-like protein 1 n=1 Tax=Panagrellus redivivus TaxID=6233 RepID=A0A7E4VV41_PANRE
MLRFLLVVVACLGIAAPHKIMPCYITRDAHYRQGDARFEPENYSIGICSHIIVGFAKINPDEEYSVYDHHDMQFYERVVGLRFQQAGLKIFLSIGGPDTESWMFSNVLQTKQSREHFAQHVMGLVRRFAFDGVDLAWFYPTVADKANYFYLLQSLKAKFDYNGLVSATVSANPTLIQNNYDVGAIANIVDFVNVMTHDYLGPHESKTG